MVRQHCPECGTEVPVDDVTGVCHVGHRVNSPAAPAAGTSSAFPDAAADAASDADEPAPWVATVDDDVVGEPTDRGPGTPPAAHAAGSAPPPASGVDPDLFRDPVPVARQPEPAPDDTSLEELAALAATPSGGTHEDTDLSALSDDLRGDLGAATDDFDLDSLEEAVAEFDGGTPAPATPELTPRAPGPDAAPDPAVAVADVAQVPEHPDDLHDLDAFADVEPPLDAPSSSGADDATGPASEPVSIRPDHDVAPVDAPAQSATAPLDTAYFTASGKGVPRRSDRGGEGLVARLRRLLGR